MMLVHLASVLTGCSTKGSMCPQKRPQNCTLMKSTPSYATNYFTFLVATCLPMLRLPHFTLAFFFQRSAGFLCEEEYAFLSARTPSAI
uniref:Uncharacterized protein n=1 Tax=Ixodes ricinus TaxID=34613 RepID=A0A147BF00_IXORI